MRITSTTSWGARHQPDGSSGEGYRPIDGLGHVAELLASHGLFAWGSLALGTDFDGIVDPINGYWTHEQLPALSDYLLMHAHNYLASSPQLTLPANRAVHEEEIVSRIMADNALAFLLKYLPAST